MTLSSEPPGHWPQLPTFAGFPSPPAEAVWTLPSRMSKHSCPHPGALARAGMLGAGARARFLQQLWAPEGGRLGIRK